ncbi:MAG: EAL domain-containing protein [Hydrogenophilus sp.]|nr:EAL domain-containing protein [Hydrogenophilus sp.]
MPMIKPLSLSSGDKRSFRRHRSLYGEAAIIAGITVLVALLFWWGWIEEQSEARARTEVEERVLEEIAQVVRLAEILWPWAKATLRDEVQRHMVEPGLVLTAVLDGAHTVLAAHDPSWVGQPLAAVAPLYVARVEAFAASGKAFVLTSDGAMVVGLARWSVPPDGAVGPFGTVVWSYTLTPYREEARAKTVRDALPALAGLFGLVTAVWIWSRYRLLIPLGRMVEALRVENPTAERLEALTYQPQPRELAELAANAAENYRQLEVQAQQLRLLSRAVEASPASIMITDTTPRIVWANPAFERVTGYTLAEVKGRNPSFLRSGLTPAAVYRELWDHLSRGEIWKGEFINRRKSGEIYSEMTVIAPVADSEGRVTHYVAVKFDTSREKALTQAVQFATSHDLLTELPNRTAFLETLTQTLAAVRSRALSAMVVLMNMRGFRAFNDRYGNSAGDLLLRAAAARLQELVEPHELVARLSGDEFALLLYPLLPTEREEVEGERLESAARLRFERLQEGLSLPLSLPAPQERGWPTRVALEWWFGVVVVHGEFVSGSDLLAAASLALARAKRSGQGVAWYDPNDAAALARQVAIAEGLRQVLSEPDCPGLALAWQAQLLRGEELIGAEALLRFAHPTLGPISPAEFIPIAENNEWIVPLGAWVLQQATAQGAAWQREWGFQGTISVNVSPKQLMHPDFPTTVRRALARSGWRGELLILEITENILLAEAERAVALMKGLSEELGVQWSIDDFGTGYSSLAYLNELPVHELKIDQRFIRRLVERPGEIRLVRAIVQIATTYGLRVVAEGVEDERCAAALREFPTLLHQGWHYGRPEPATAFAERFLARGNREGRGPL